MVSLHAFASTELAVLDEPITLLIVGDLELALLDVVCGGHFVLLLLPMLWSSGNVEMWKWRWRVEEQKKRNKDFCFIVNRSLRYLNELNLCPSSQ